ncbi:MAG: DUF756 domain-containing protein, partial [Bordetella sp.]|nr:DUF756 domain-containing protein [Bordetella sp.]
GEFLNRGGRFSHAGQGQTRLRVDGLLDNDHGWLASKAASLSISAARLTNHDGDLMQAGNGTLELSFVNRGTAGAVFHVYDRLHLDRVPRRYTVEAGKRLRDQWLLEESGGEYDLWVLGPNGFHRHLRGRAEAGMPEVALQYLPQAGRLRLTLHNPGTAPHLYTISDTVYGQAPAREELLAGQSRFDLEIDISRQGHWYDLTIEATGLDGWSRRCAGRMETGAPSISDPAMGGPVRLQQA